CPGREGAPVGAGELAGDPGVGPGDDRRDVAGDARCGGEAPHGRVVVVGGGLRLGRGGVGDHSPVPRCGDGEAEARLEVGLLEDGEDPAGVGDLELAVEVDLVVHRVDEPVQALTGAHVAGGGDDEQLVALLHGGERDAGAVPRVGVEVAAV